VLASVIDAEVLILVLLVYALPLGLALVAARHARSRGARATLHLGVLTFAVLFAVASAVPQFCTGSILKGLAACTPGFILTIEPVLAPVLLAGILLGYPILGPVLVILAAILEWRERR
jgi:hypothetical protein